MENLKRIIEVMEARSVNEGGEYDILYNAVAHGYPFDELEKYGNMKEANELVALLLSILFDLQEDGEIWYAPPLIDMNELFHELMIMRERMGFYVSP